MKRGNYSPGWRGQPGRDNRHREKQSSGYLNMGTNHPLCYDSIPVATAADRSDIRQPEGVKTPLKAFFCIHKKVISFMAGCGGSPKGGSFPLGDYVRPLHASHHHLTLMVAGYLTHTKGAPMKRQHTRRPPENRLPGFRPHPSRSIKRNSRAPAHARRSVGGCHE